MTNRTEPSVAILSAVRTPIGRFGGALRGLSAPALGSHVARAAIERSGIRAEEVEEVLFGQGIQAGVGQNPARQVLRGAGIPDSVGAATVNMVCGSGLKAILLGFTAIRAEEFDRVLVGGMESMSNAPHLLPGSLRWGSKPGPHTMDDAMQRDGLMDAYDEHELMGLTGERVAQHFGLTRAEVDAFALRSNQRAVKAMEDGTFSSEVVPVPPGGTRRGPGRETEAGVRPERGPHGRQLLPDLRRRGRARVREPSRGRAARPEAHRVGPLYRRGWRSPSGCHGSADPDRQEASRADR